MATPTDVVEAARRLTKGARKAVLLMAPEWRFAGKATFDHNGAWNASIKARSAVEKEVRKDGKYSRYAYRLTPFGLAVRQHLLQEQAQKNRILP